MFIFFIFSVRLLHLSLWTATQKTLHISLPGDPGQIDQEVTEVDSNAGKSKKNNLTNIRRLKNCTVIAMIEKLIVGSSDQTTNLVFTNFFHQSCSVEKENNFIIGPKRLFFLSVEKIKTNIT